MKRYLLGILIFVHIALVMMLIGACALDYFTSFLNWFQNTPESLAAAKAYYDVSNPAYFFIAMYLLVMLSGGVFVAAAWQTEPARIYVLIDIVLFAATLVLLLGFVFPRIDSIIPGDGKAAVNVPVVVQELAVLFQIRHLATLAAAAFGLFGLWRFYINVPKTEVVVVEAPVEENS